MDAAELRNQGPGVRIPPGAPLFTSSPSPQPSPQAGSSLPESSNRRRVLHLSRTASRAIVLILRRIVARRTQRPTPGTALDQHHFKRQRPRARRPCGRGGIRLLHRRYHRSDPGNPAGRRGHAALDVTLEAVAEFAPDRRSVGRRHVQVPTPPAGVRRCRPKRCNPPRPGPPTSPG